MTDPTADEPLVDPADQPGSKTSHMPPENPSRESAAADDGTASAAAPGPA